MAVGFLFCGYGGMAGAICALSCKNPRCLFVVPGMALFVSGLAGVAILALGAGHCSAGNS